MSTKSRHKQLPITMFLSTPTPTNGRKNEGTTPMTRKRRRELEMEAGKDPTTPDSARVETPVPAGKRAKRSSKPTPKPTPGAKGKTRFQQRDVDSDEGKRAGPSKPPTHRAVRATRKAGNLLTPESEGIFKEVAPPEDNAVSSLKTPLAELKLGARRTSTESPLPRNTRRDLRSSNIGLPTPIPSSRGASKSKVENPSKILAREAPESPEPEPIDVSSSPLSPLTDLPEMPSPPHRPPAQNSSPIFKIPALPLHTPRRKRVENRLRDTSPPRHSTTAMCSDEGVVPTSQSQDLRPFLISPPRPGGSALLKDTTPKSLRRSQGYTKHPPQPLPSVLAAIQARGHAGTQESDFVATSQMEEAELRIPRSARAEPPRSLVSGSPSDRAGKIAPSHRELPSSQGNGVLRTPTKITNLPHDGKVHIMSPITGLSRSPKRDSPTHRDDGDPSTSPLPPSSIPMSTDPNMSGHDDAALDFVQYQTTPTKRRTSLDSPRKSIKLFESQATLSPTWSQPRSFEKWRLRDLLYESQHGFGDGKAGLEAEAEGREPGGSGSGRTDGAESEELEKDMMMASSMTEAESQDLAEWFSRVHPELKHGGKAPQYKSGASSHGSSSKSGPDSAKRGSGGRVEQDGVIVIDDTPPTSQNSKGSEPDPITNRIDNVGMVSSSPVKTSDSLTESDSQSGGSRKVQDDALESQGPGIGESALIFSQLSPDPLRAFLDMFEGASSMPQDSQSVIDIDD